MNKEEFQKISLACLATPTIFWNALKWREQIRGICEQIFDKKCFPLKKVFC